MAANFSKAGIAFALASVVLIGAIGGVVLTTHVSDENPNGILGLYSLYDYVQGGIGSDDEWHWYETGSGQYEGEQIYINYYSDNFVKGKCYIKGETYDISGYYDPESYVFGYVSCYGYSPDGNADMLDILYGSVKDGVMILTGYTLSSGSNESYAFKFIFLKDGVSYVEPHYVQADISGASMQTVDVSVTGGVARDTASADTYTYSLVESRDGVYRLTLTVGAGTAVSASAVSVFRDGDYDYLKCIYVDGDGSKHIDWLIAQGNTGAKKLAFAIMGDGHDSTKSRTVYFTSAPSARITTISGSLDAKVFFGSDKHVDCYSGNVSLVQSSHPATGPISYAMYESGHDSYEYVINFWPNFCDMFSYKFFKEIGGIPYQGELLGYAGSDGSLHSFGFLFSSKGDVFVVKKDIVPVA